MLFDIYQLDGTTGDQLAAMMRKPRLGNVVIKKRFPGRADSQLLVEVHDPDKPQEPVMLMHYVKLIGMSGDSLVIEGTIGHPLSKSFKSRVEYQQHRWLLKPPGTKVVIDAETFRKSKTSLAAAMNANPFHPMWDDVPEENDYGPNDLSI